MARRRRPKSASEAFLDILPQAVGLILLAVFFVPGAKEFLGGLLVIVVVIGVVAIAGLIVLAVMRRLNRLVDDGRAVGVASTPALPVGHSRPQQPLVESPLPTWTLEFLRSLEWKRFEELVCAYVRELGYAARLTRRGADGGVDIEVLDAATDDVAMVVQCKAWNVYQVGIKPVRELYGVMAAKKIPQCAFFTTGTYTAEAFAFGREHDVDLVDGAEFLRRINGLQLPQIQLLLECATRGDYTTPTCPNCDVKMVLRTAAKGRNEGEDFWGCRHYPRCRQTFKCTAAEPTALRS